jgi:hypothetical protein
MEEKKISIAKDFSRFPGGRYYDDGDFSGQRFREEFLLPLLTKGEHISLDLDGTLGLGSSFLEECFGGLVREHGLSASQIRKNINFLSENEILIETILLYIDEAIPKKKKKD